MVGKIILLLILKILHRGVCSIVKVFESKSSKLRAVTDLLIIPEPEFDSECYSNKYEMAERLEGDMNGQGPTDI